MPLSELIQKLIHMSEVGAGSRYLRFFVVGLAVVGLALVYNLRAYRNFATQEAMDSAQLARNIAEGKGYTTLFIRPFSLYLVQSHNEAKHAAAPATTNAGFRTNQIHPPSGPGESAGVSGRAGRTDEGAAVSLPG